VGFEREGVGNGIFPLQKNIKNRRFLKAIRQLAESARDLVGSTNLKKHTLTVFFKKISIKCGIICVLIKVCNFYRNKK